MRRAVLLAVAVVGLLSVASAQQLFDACKSTEAALAQCVPAQYCAPNGQPKTLPNFKCAGATVCCRRTNMVLNVATHSLLCEAKIDAKCQIMPNAELAKKMPAGFAVAVPVPTAPAPSSAAAPSPRRAGAFQEAATESSAEVDASQPFHGKDLVNCETTDAASLAVCIPAEGCEKSGVVPTKPTFKCGNMQINGGAAGMRNWGTVCCRRTAVKVNPKDNRNKLICEAKANPICRIVGCSQKAPAGFADYAACVKPAEDLTPSAAAPSAPGAFLQKLSKKIRASNALEPAQQ